MDRPVAVELLVAAVCGKRAVEPVSAIPSASGAAINVFMDYLLGARNCLGRALPLRSFGAYVTYDSVGANHCQEYKFCFIFA
jgi:hypothetical protein